jgi:hypothetical protein
MMRVSLNNQAGNSANNSMPRKSVVDKKEEANIWVKKRTMKG